MSVFPSGHGSHSKTPYQSINAIFSVTPDSLPFAGELSQVPGLFIAAGIWVTHAAGVARLVSDLVSGKDLSQADIKLQRAFDPDRFREQDTELLTQRALGTYNDIYNKQNH